MNDVTKFNPQWLNPDTVNSVVVGAPTLGEATANAADAFNALDALTNEAKNSVLDKQIVQFQQQADVTKTIAAQNQALRQEMQASMERSAELKRLPKIVTNVIGFFDKDYSVAVQEDKARTAAFGIDANNAMLESAASLMEMQQKLYASQLQQVQSDAELGGNRITRALEVRKQMQADEQQALANKLALSAEARAAQMHTLSVAQIVSQEQRAKASADREAMLFEQGQLARSYTLKSDKELEAMAQGGDQMAVKETQSRKATQLALDQAAQAAVSTDMTLNNAKKGEALRTMNSIMLTSLAEKAQTNGGTVEFQTEHGPVKFTSREISSALTEVQKAQDDATKYLGERAMSLFTVEYGSKAALEDIVTIGQAMGGQMPAVLNRGYKKYEAEVQALLSIGDNKGAAAKTDALLAEINQWKTDYIKSLPEAQRSFAENRLNQMPANRESALNYMAGSALSKPLGATGSVPSDQFITSGPDAKYAPMMEPIIAKFNEKLAEARGKGMVADPSSPLGFTEDKGSAAKISQIWQQAVAEAGPAAMKQFKDARDIGAVKSALEFFQKSNPQVFGGFSMNDFSEVIKEKDAQGNLTGKTHTEFNTNRALWKMRQAWERDKAAVEDRVRTQQQESGAPASVRINTPLPYDEQFLQYLGSRSMQQELLNKWSAGLTMDGAAASNLIHNGAILAGYPQTLNAIKSSYDMFSAEQTKKAQEEAQKIMEITKILKRQPTAQEVTNFLTTGSPYEPSPPGLYNFGN